MPYIVAGSLLGISLFSIVSYYLIRIKLHLFHFLLLLWMTSYWVSVIFALDRHSAVLEALKITFYLPMIMLFSLLTPVYRRRLFYQWPWLGAVFVLWGFLFGLMRDHRLESTLEYANALAILLLSSLMISMYQWIRTKRWRDGLLILWNGFGLYWTSSRGVWLILCLLLVAWLIIDYSNLRKRKPVVLLTSLPVMILAISVLYQNWFGARLRQSFTANHEWSTRWSYWQDGWRMIQDNWLWGVGADGWISLQPDWYYVKYLHHFYLQTWIDAGLLAILSFVALITIPLVHVLSGWWRRLRKQVENKHEASDLFNSCLSLISLGFLMHAWMDLPLAYPLLMMMLLMCLYELTLENEVSWRKKK
ncbi:O-antigen ligase family protein [Marinicrinis sediminis]|uniref:O-antigen ligase family protein n=1 Tax=Marinicrinis sediminis TaxID=1652465 RepID=A0ABW5RB96_9BACL